MINHEDAAKGVQLAQAAVHAIADGDDAHALGLLNTAEHAHLAWASASLLGALRSTVTAWTGGDATRTAAALHQAASKPDDVTITVVEAIVAEALAREVTS